MIIQFLLKLIFFYFIYTFVKSILKGYFSKRPVVNRNSQDTQRKKSSPPSGDIFEAEYKVVKEES